MKLELDRRAVMQAAIAGAIAGSTQAEAQAPQANLSTHALDMYLGKPAAGIRIDFSRKDGDTWSLLRTVATDESGHFSEALMSGDAMRVGRYELLFHVEDYYRRAGVTLSDPAFLDTVPIRFAIFDASQAYHVPLYFSPWGILSYRGR